MKRPFIRVESQNPHFDKHTYRVRFAFFPVRRWESVTSRGAIPMGWYFWRIIVEIKAGLHADWTAYAQYNDKLKTSSA